MTMGMMAMADVAENNDIEAEQVGYAVLCAACFCAASTAAYKLSKTVSSNAHAISDYTASWWQRKPVIKQSELQRAITDYDESCVKHISSIDDVNSALQHQLNEIRLGETSKDQSRSKADIVQMLHALKEKIADCQEKLDEVPSSRNGLFGDNVNRQTQQIENEIDTLQQLAIKLVQELQIHNSQREEQRHVSMAT